MLKVGEDYIINENGLMVLTREYHLKRGYCCMNSCLNCPWDFAKKVKEISSQANPKKNK
ncbi:DUF5522 domain-containing protein [Solitalea agri]|nr:DUF5522 domain-containing protein [Solitalea agri]